MSIAGELRKTLSLIETYDLTSDEERGAKVDAIVTAIEDLNERLSRLETDGK